MPREKEMWQAAQELALRLENVDEEVPADELPGLGVTSRASRLYQGGE